MTTEKKYDLIIQQLLALTDDFKDDQKNKEKIMLVIEILGSIKL